MVLKGMNKKKEERDRITWRGHEVTRIEGFSDAVFGFSLTLLIVSLEVPKTYEELVINLRGFIPFGVCFVLFFQIWKTQNLFFRRYGMHDSTTLFLNACLLFMVLFFVYPMKFLFKLAFSGGLIEAWQFSHLFCIYSGAWAMIYFIFTCMYGHAKRRKEFLKLTHSEVFETQTEIYVKYCMVGIGILSALMALCGGSMANFAGAAFALIGICLPIIHSRRNKLYDKMFHSSGELKGTSDNEPHGEKLRTE